MHLVISGEDDLSDVVSSPPDATPSHPDTSDVTDDSRSSLEPIASSPACAPSPLISADSPSASDRSPSSSCAASVASTTAASSWAPRYAPPAGNRYQSRQVRQTEPCITHKRALHPPYKSPTSPMKEPYMHPKTDLLTPLPRSAEPVWEVCVSQWGGVGRAREREAVGGRQVGRGTR